MNRPSEHRQRYRVQLSLAIGMCALTGIMAYSVLAAVADWKIRPTKDFPLAGGNYFNHRFSSLDRINASNVKTLGGAWMIHLEEGLRGGQLGNLDATPIVVDGVMYVTTGLRNVLAIDAKTGTVKWRYRPDPSVVGSNKGVVVAEGKVIFGRRDNHLIALNQETGAVEWATVRFGLDPNTSALDANCKAHEVDNLYVVDGSFFVSSGAVNPALTIMANALRVGDHLLERLGARSSAPADVAP